MKIETNSYTSNEIKTIIEKMNNLSINFIIKDNIDIKTYNYLINFSRT